RSVAADHRSQRIPRPQQCACSRTPYGCLTVGLWSVYGSLNKQASVERRAGSDVVVMSLDDALTLAGQVLADYDGSGQGDAPEPDLLWGDQLARALRELAEAVSTWHVAPVSDRPVAVIAAGRQGWPGGRRPSRVRNALAWIVRARAGEVPEPGAVVL